MPGSGNGLRRLRAFYEERAAGGSAGLLATEFPAEGRLRALAEYRRAQRRPVGLGPQEGQPNWTPLGPYAVLRGQGATTPVVSGRVRGIAVSDDGRRIYVGSANGGVWRSEDAGRTWLPLSDEEERAPATSHHVDSLACGAIAFVDKGSVGADRLYVGTGEPTAVRNHPATGYLGVGLIRSDDGGSNWHPEASDTSLVGRGVFALVVDPADEDHAVAATTTGVLRRQATSAPPWKEEPLLGLGTGQACSGLAVSRAGGTTTFYVSTASGSVFSSTAAPPWNALPAMPGGGKARVTLACSAGATPVLYALACDGRGLFEGVYRIKPSDPAPAWSRIGNPPTDLFGDPSGSRGQGDYDQAMVVDPNDPDLVYLGGSTKEVSSIVPGAESKEWSAAIYRCRVSATSAGGFTCAKEMIGGSSHADVHALVLRPGSSRELWVGCDGGVFAAADARTGSERVFESRNAGLATLTLTGLDHLAGVESYAFCGAQDNGGLRWHGSEIWDHQMFGDGGATVVNHKDRRRLLSNYHNERVRRAEIHSGRYVLSEPSPPTTSHFTLFYPPMAASPVDGDFVVFGAERPYITPDFCDSWQQLPFPTPPIPPQPTLPVPTTAAPSPPTPPRIRALAVFSTTKFYAGWTTGHVTRYTRGNAGTWVGTDLGTGDNRPVTGIALDPRSAAGDSIFITVGGATGAGTPRVRWFDATATPPAWAAGIGAGLLDIQHNAILATGPVGGPVHLYAAADLGVWESPDSGQNWTPLERNLPDVAVLDLDLVELPRAGLGPVRLLRATTHGRGVHELRLDQVQEPTELFLRRNDLDRGYRDVEADKAQPLTPGVPSTLDSSPDIFVEVPDASGRFAVPADQTPTLVELAEKCTGATILTSTPGAPLATRVHVLVRNRGVRRTRDVRVSLMIGPAGEPLPDTYVDYATTGAMTEQHGWVGVASVRAPEIWAGHHAVVTFEVSSDLLPDMSESAGRPYRLLATLHHADDLFPDSLPAPTTDPVQLVTKCRKAALKRVTLVSGEGRTNAVGGTGLLVSMSTTVLTHRRLASITTDLRGKVTTGATVTPVERRVLAMAEAGLAAIQAGPRPDLVPPPTGPTVGKFALLGSLGFELPTYTSALMPGGTWVAEVLRRGTADPHLSKVAVPTTELALEFAKRGGPGATATELPAAKGFATGLLAGAAAGVVLGPQLADLLSQDTSADWSPTSTSRGLRAVERLVRNTYLAGPTLPVTAWLPTADAVPPKLWEHFIKAIEATHGLPAVLDPGFLVDVDRGPWLTPNRLRDGYQLLLDDARTESWGFWPWFFAISPILVMPSVAFGIARTLPHAKAFVEGGELDERAVFEALMLAEGLGSLTPFLYSMIMWSKIGDHTDAFVTALLMGLVRLALPIAALATSDDEGQSPATRWAGLFLPTAAADVYAGLRAGLDSGRRPGNSKVFGLQTVPGVTSLATLAWLGLARAITGEEPTESKSDWTFWVMTFATGVVTLAAAGIPTAVALSNGGGWRSWFLRRTGQLPLLSSVSSVGTEPLTPTASARVYPQAQLWSAPGGPDDLDKLAYPAGMRTALRFWWEGEGELSVKFGESSLTFRHNGADQVVDLPAPPTAAAIARRLETQVAGLRTEVVTPSLGDVPLPTPRTLADLGDEALVENADTLRDHFVRVPTVKARGLPLRQSPRVEQSEQAGRVAGNQDQYVVVPADDAARELDTGIRDAADLAALLVLASSPTLATVTVDPPAGLPDPQIKEVMQVFRRWNLDERRADEWKSLMTGHGSTAPPADPRRDTGALGDQNVMIRPQPRDYVQQEVGREVAEALGWLPLWRAWLRVATDVGTNVAAADDAGNPEITLPGQATRRATNRELTDGVRFLLDLGDT